MSRLASIASAALLSFILVPAAQAQLVGLKHVWSIPGVMNTAAGLGTFITCTNASTSTQAIGVEVYGAAGAFVSSASISVASNATVLFGTSFAAGFSVDASLATGTLAKGHARVMASGGKGVLCSAFIADGANPSPTSVGNLTVAKKFSQKGD